MNLFSYINIYMVNYKSKYLAMKLKYINAKQKGGIDASASPLE